MALIPNSSLSESSILNSEFNDSESKYLVIRLQHSTSPRRRRSAPTLDSDSDFDRLVNSEYLISNFEILNTITADPN